ncbi:MAG: hypothetical protein LBR81_07740 [Prevotellaceae bacterium]|jgi:plasmid maintenance system antidote protein VapI|nr:hypothetical protein [Prevotellaceae bacterium]
MENSTLQHAGNMPHNGNLLKKHIEESRLLPSHVAKRMGISFSTLRTFYNRQTVQTKTLWTASMALGYNFFFDLGMQLPQNMESALDTELKKRVEQLEKENERLKTEIGVYEKILRK